MIGSDSETGRSGQLGAFLGAPQREAKGDPYIGSVKGCTGRGAAAASSGLDRSVLRGRVTLPTGQIACGHDADDLGGNPGVPMEIRGTTNGFRCHPL